MINSQALYAEYSKTLKYLFLNIGKLPDILEKYYNLDFEALLQKIDQLKNPRLETSISTNYSSSHISVTNLPQDAKDFFEYIDEQTFILDIILSFIRDFVEILIKFKEFSQKNVESVYPEDLNYYIHINILERNLLELDKLMNDSTKFKYLKNSYDSFLYMLYNDFSLLKSLLSAYKHIINLDVLLSTSNMVLSVRLIEQIKCLYPRLDSLKLYSFFQHFYLDNFHKFHLIFETYLFKKQNNLISDINFNFDPNSKILEDIFKKREVQYEEKVIQKFDTNKLDLVYFILIFQRKKFSSSVYFEEKSSLLKLQYKNNMNFIESNEEFGILKIFHITTADTTDKVLNELMTLDKKDFFNKHKSSNNQYIIIYPLTSFLFIIAKIKGKNPEDILILTDILIDLKNKFANRHIFEVIY
jgi:hypothetical protein